MRKNLQIILAFLLFGGIVAVIFWVAKKIPETWIPIITAGAGYLLSRMFESWRENKSRLHEKKRDVYAQLLKPWQSLLIGTIVDKEKNNTSTQVSSETISDAATAAFTAILYASDEVVKDYGRFRNIASDNTEITPELVLGHLSRLLKSIRRDLGNTYSNLTDYEILRMFINLTPEDEIKYRNISKLT